MRNKDKIEKPADLFRSFNCLIRHFHIFFDLNKPIILNGSTDDVDYDYDDGEIIASTEEEVDEIIDNENQGETRLRNNLAPLS